MASNPAATPDTPVTLKINVDGNNRRFKLPLRDLGASTLPEKLRFLLAIPPTSEAIFERYSDSAAAFVVLDPNNSAVYKQLYRAAKAKLKLRLKVTVKDKEPVVPKPATVEDEAPRPRTPLAATLPPVTESESASATVEESSKIPVVPAPAPAASVADLERGVEQLLIDHPGWTKPSTACTITSRDTCLLSAPEPAKPAGASSSDIPVTHNSTARDRWFAELVGASDVRRNAATAAAAHKPAEAAPAPVHNIFTVYCNHCESAIPNEHFHCDNCDEGDFDLCQACVSNGVVCKSSDHWMIKRFVKNGEVINSTTELLSPKFKHREAESPAAPLPTQEPLPSVGARTCNCCVQELPDASFITCIVCEDYDLCIPCHVENQHGHHPGHAFSPAVAEAESALNPVAKALLAPGRNSGHNAICDACDKYIYGVRHKCLDCPDWDYCSACMATSSYTHPRHRFVPIYEPLNDHNSLSRLYRSQPRHHGIYCDGPLCKVGTGTQTYIRGDRYKCAVCHDTDFCASCEASPWNPHNRTHPLIKFKTPVRNVNVTTLGEQEDGQMMPVMGDRRGRPVPQAAETTRSPSTNAATQVQTVADLSPTEQVKAELAPATETPLTSETKAEEVKELPAAIANGDLVAYYVRDAIADGTVMAPNTVFEQTWILRNGGSSAWPAGCTVKFVGGDNMCAVDPDHPASVHELVSAAESTTCYTEVAPGQEVGFTVLMRTPNRTGNFISYWRLTGPRGDKFGHRLWCDVNVKDAPVVTKQETEETEEIEETEAEGSQMIFPKLEKESPATSFHEDAPTSAPEAQDVDEEFEIAEEETFGDEETEDGFLTDEEYDILDASDEEYLVEQQKGVKK